MLMFIIIAAFSGAIQEIVYQVGGGFARDHLSVFGWFIGWRWAPTVMFGLAGLMALLAYAGVTRDPDKTGTTPKIASMLFLMVYPLGFSGLAKLAKWRKGAGGKRGVRRTHDPPASLERIQ